MKPIEIEIFRAGTKASRGLTADHIAEVADRDCEALPVGICFGHPKSDTPAAGSISGLRADGPSLFATIASFTKKAIDGIKSDEWLNRSAAFFRPDDEANPTPGKWSLRHLGLLGGAAPGIPGMKPLKKALAFDAEGELLVDGDPAEAIIFEAGPPPAPTDIVPVFEAAKEKPTMTPEEIAAAEKKLADDRAEFTALQDTARKAGTTAAVARLIVAGKVKPADKAALEHVFNALGGDVIEFSADATKPDQATAATKLESILMAGPNAVPVNRERQSPTDQFNAKSEPTGDVQKDANRIDARARALMKERPELTFDAAVEEIFDADAAAE